MSSKDSEFLPFRTAHYVQTADIDFEGGTHNSIGNTNDAAPFSFFCGKYNGNGYKISNFVVNRTNSKVMPSVSIFNAIATGAEIRDVTFENVTFADAKTPLVNIIIVSQ